jgi:hypothetical protein
MRTYCHRCDILYDSTMRIAASFFPQNTLIHVLMHRGIHTHTQTGHIEAYPQAGITAAAF